MKLNATSVCLALAAASLCVSCCTTNRSSTGPTLALFNGKDFAGWKYHLADPAVKMEQVWSVQNGIIICKGEPMGYLYTEQSFKDFKYQAEYRWAPGKEPGNSGLFTRITGEPRPLPRCFETQLKHGNAGDLYGFHGQKLSGPAARYKFVPNHQIGGDLSGVSRLAGNEKPAGEWNQVEVVVKGSTITVWFNGVKVNEAVDAEVVAGPVGLQSEGGEVHFRNVRITPLD